MVEVAVIGSGAAGLVAARHLLRCGLRACLFDSRDRWCGAWTTDARVNITPPNRPQMWPSLKPNLSRYTCAFSDFPWPDDTDLFPSLGEMEQYLEGYANKFLRDDPSCSTMFGCTVTEVSRSESKYSIKWKDSDGSPVSKVFDGVVVATGFLSEPKWPAAVDTWELSHNTTPSPNGINTIVHSSEYNGADQYTEKTVAVVGGSFSAHEISADVRSRASRVVNIMGSTYHYVLPRFIPDSTGSFSPIDWVLYKRSQDAPVTEVTTLTHDECRKRHEAMRSLIGPAKLARLRDKGFPPLPPLDSPPMVSISDKFLDLVIDDKIEVRTQRLEAISQDESGNPVLSLDNGDILDGIDHVLMCTGYRSNLGFLSPDILSVLEYENTDSFQPFIACHDTFHPNLPGLGFVGMYRGAYFGVMELQARVIAAQLSGKIEPPTENQFMKKLEASRSIRRSKLRGQFPRFDYIGMLDSLAEYVGLTPGPNNNGSSGSYVVPAFYQSSANFSRRIKSEMDGNVSNRMALGKATLSALVGNWTFDRVINDKITCSQQVVEGVVRYTLQDEHFESLRYREDGFLLLPNGNKLDVFREYDYCHNGNGLDIFFVENGKRTYQFLGLLFDKTENGEWVATSDHLCIDDLYKGTFKVRFDGLGAQQVSMTYRVRGPKKDYESVTVLRPLTSETRSVQG